jgi:hypothetical protein
MKLTKLWPPTTKHAELSKKSMPNIFIGLRAKQKMAAGCHDENAILASFEVFSPIAKTERSYRPTVAEEVSLPDAKAVSI